jgi:hypothetical protein
MDVTGLVSPAASALELKEILCTNANNGFKQYKYLLEDGTNALLGTIVVYQVNNTHSKNSPKVFSYNSP